MKNTFTTKDNQASQLLHAYQNGDDHAFSLLYKMYIQMMLNYGRCLTSNLELIKDCCHDVFMKLLDRNNPPHITRMSSFLIISLRNKLIDEFRRNTFTTEISIDEIRYLGGIGNNVEESYLHREAKHTEEAKVSYLMAYLTPRQRQVFDLYYLQERKYDEICRIMNMNYHSVRNLVHRGMTKLRSEAV
ncbi:MAG: sigma-70 family RNA polymerase sigma factor [Prevotella sp.]|jgi:RNA polymerase sigma factor (sigma-70 family)|nr:sigma-70 family RNA polymerase sigma factor [Prevotella sp.]MCH4181711.1 sigma-70 family RNA polymerase sigma factor [Prevotella sp.]MCH4211454.1 sigma-70 family RNA polymerase sigma factor [Prevotella sp.]MCH4240757.1 sigma-70 family RNA polymerase sigma factor [Prevotella sp.]MCI1741036.1 sigma-70 family RNA polymerase sigma factor [Prevotella sp.]